MSQLKLAIPSKGRLKEQTEAFFADAGLKIRQIGGARGYAARIDGVDGLDVQLMSASEISAAVIAGGVHVGVTGEDQMREMAPQLERVAHLLAPLGFGHANLVVAAPRSWIDVDTMADIDDVGARHEARTGETLRVATKYIRSTRRFFSEAGVGHYRIVESAGATEGAPAAGLAELIVDITTTGATLEGNGLKIIRDGLILQSQAQLAASFKAEWSETALSALRALLDILDARGRGKGRLALRFDPKFDAKKLSERALELLSPGEALCVRDEGHRLARAIAAAGGGPVRTMEAGFIYRGENERHADFVKALAASSR